MSVSDALWSPSTADYSPEQWQRACLIDTEQGDSLIKERYKLPVKEPSGEVNRNGVHAAAGRIKEVEGISAGKRSAAARQLLSMYRNDLGEDPPDDLVNMGSFDDAEGHRSAPPEQERFTTNLFKGWDKQFEGVMLRSAEGSNGRHIGGYAARFDCRSLDLGGFQEIVTGGFFNKSIAEDFPGVVCRFNHQDNYLLGATRSKTLRVYKDSLGLQYDVELPRAREDVLEMVQRRDLAHSSFAFQTYADEWRAGEGGYPIRMLVSGKLIDVAPVTVPAYPDATVGLRSLSRAVGAPYDEVVTRAERDELRSFFVRTDIDGGAPTSKKPLLGAQARMDLLKKKNPQYKTD